ncbi:hypothetical protein [Ancylomarina sp. 16SWW S1-10-2]|uniref:hypothetical protein n=1 Tax=Ancylomarina sp. 16SWW S1-10-2 TaxID=2499681 RepID=UPI0012AE9307|nr:hypothetical protein [Ancylomarina sp. 16SWW S1-10-2]MRT92771.1 hypothetical protein [Ancylomarina sp. 16SWW S1-10-2]
MKKVLFALAICGLAFTSCNSTGKKVKTEEVHQHEGHNHEGHDHGVEGHEHNQEEFKVDSTTKTSCSGCKSGCTAEETKSCCDSKKVKEEHEGHDHENCEHKH